MTDKKTAAILKHTFNELDRVIDSEREEKGSAEQPTLKKRMIRKKSTVRESELESMDE